VTSLQHLTVNEALVKVAANLQYQIENTGLKTLRVRVPTNAESVHFKGMAQQLAQPRVHALVSAVVTGNPLPELSQLAIDSVIESGLLKRDSSGQLVVSTPIYHSWATQALLRGEELRSAVAALTHVHGLRAQPINMLNELKRFHTVVQDTWPRMREQSSNIRESTPQALLLLFLDKLKNGGGTVLHEVGAGTGRVDLYVKVPWGQDKHTECVIEVKTRRKGDGKGSKDSIIAGAVEQARKYALKKGVKEVYVVYFEQHTKGKAPELAIQTKQGEPAVTVLCM